MSYGKLKVVSTKMFGHGLPKKHSTALDALIRYPWLRDYEFIAVVRNPWAWIRSYYLFIRHTTKNPDTGKSSHHHLFPTVSSMTFERFVEWVTLEHGLANLSSRRKSYFANKRPILQQDWIAGTNQEPLTPHVARFERLTSDFARICADLRLPIGRIPHENQSPTTISRTKFSRRAANLIGDYFEEDIKLFNY